MKKTYKYVIFSPYFGKLPNNFNLWLYSCSFNREFMFIVFTDDDTKYSTPQNVTIVNISFDKFRSYVQEKFNFNISLKTPYKLCDYKPSYGYIFSEYLNNCEYWGYCDLDLIFGNIKNFLPSKDYYKISYLGHFSLYKNCKQINELFMFKQKNVLNYIDILSNEEHFGFDEINDYSINSIFKVNNIDIYDYNAYVADVDCRRDRLFIVKYDGERFKFDKNEKLFIFDYGSIYSFDVNKKNIDQEYAYVHFQKRKMINKVTNLNRFVINYNSFTNYNIMDNIDKLLISRKTPSLNAMFIMATLQDSETACLRLILPCT